MKRLEFEIAGIFEYLMKNRNFRNSYHYNNDYDCNAKSQKAYLKNEGWKHIESIITETLEGSDIDYKVIERKYNKSIYQKYIKIELINNNNSIYIDDFRELKDMSYKLGNKLHEYGLLLV